MSDSGQNGLRSVLDIPVIAPGKASYLTCLLLASNFGVLTQWDPWKALYKKGVREYGLSRIAYPRPTVSKYNLTHALMDGGAAYKGDD